MKGSVDMGLAAHPPEPARAPVLRIALTGDVMLGRWVNETIAREGFAYPWGDVLQVLRQADLRLVNLECALTSESREWHDGAWKAFYFRADPAAVHTLSLASVDFACVANNHIGDFGSKGLLETLRVLDEAGIAHAGAGADLAAARAPARLGAAGWRVTVVAFADYPPEWAATAHGPGINYTPVSVAPQTFATVEECVAGARRGADFVVFAIHWGPNMRERPPFEFRKFARRVLDAGADLFWGHSAHVVQGIETWHGKLILYDTGDFVDDYAVDPILRNDLSAIFLVEAGERGAERASLVPVAINDERVRLASGSDFDRVAERVTALSSELGTEVHTEGGRLTIELAPIRGG